MSARSPFQRGFSSVSEKTGPITLMEDIWLEASITATTNTTIARGGVIGANAVVTCDTKPNAVYMGVPSR
jgi:acetyltransferase-like isoleucine patch superfamily enzyme